MAQSGPTTPDVPERPPATRPPAHERASTSVNVTFHLSGRDPATIEAQLVEVAGYAGTYALGAVMADWPFRVEAEATGSLDELEAFYRQHLGLIAAERARLAEGRPS